MTLALHGKPRPALPEGPFLACGLARSGQAVARALVASGQSVIGVDAAAPEGAGGMASDGVEVHLDASGAELVERVATVVKSPGVPQDAPAIDRARSLGKIVLGELEIGWRLTTGPVIAVTGTNGKTTVTEMIGHVLRRVGHEVAVVGNVGRPISELAGGSEAKNAMVAEASSFQLEDCDGFAPEVSVFLNLSPDHIDRHGTFADYRAAKLKIFERQEESDFAIVPLGEPLDDAGGSAERITFGGRGADLSVIEGTIRWRGEEILGADRLPVPGAHNLLNAAAASAACIVAGVDPRECAEALTGFTGVAHRLELVGELDGVRWFNDSKSTNVGSTITALAAFESPIHLILGGLGKGQDFTPLGPAVAGSCASVALIGEAAGEISAAIGRAGIPVTDAGDLRSAIEACLAEATAGDVVLLSPACASFDQFSDFEDRGARFRSLVAEVAG